MNPNFLRLRAQLFRATRDFFDNQGFLEVETPVRIAAPAQEENIDCPRAGGAFLRASPELQMKRLLCDGFDKIYQLGPCFREGECGSRHQPEFTMLEWYRAHAGSAEILRDLQALIDSLAAVIPPPPDAGLDRGWVVKRVRDAFVEWAGWDPLEKWDEERFDFDLATKIEPRIPRDVPFVLTDYPAPAASLARLSPRDPRVSERWELYLRGIEIANAFGELTDPVIQRQRFEAAAAKRRAAGKAAYPMDEAFFAGLTRGMPPSGGIAVGMDRLVMVFAGANDISEVRAFCQRPGELI